MEEENKGLTLKDICKTIWLKKWIALIVAVLVALACALALYYGYNPRQKTYEIEFSLNFPGGNNSAFYSYPDGTQFHYADLTSEETLEKIKKSGDFENVNVEKMVNRGDIDIQRDVTSTASVKEGTSYTETSYTIVVKATYFSDKTQAKNFLMSVATYPTSYLENMQINYDVYLLSAKNAFADGRQTTAVKYLNDQLTFLSNEYKKLTGTYGETFVVASGKTLLACAQEVAAYEVDETDVDASIAAVEGFTNSFRTTSKAVYSKATSVVFIQPSIVVQKGGMGLIKIAVLSCVIAIVIALVAAYVAGYLSLKKKKAGSEAPSEEAPQEQPAAEAETAQTENKE